MHYLLPIRNVISSIILAILLVCYPLVVNLQSDDYVIAHDANMPATSAKALALFDVVKPINGGLVHGVVPPMSFTTALFYGALFKLELSPATVQIVAMTTTFFLAFFLAATGFESLLGRWGRTATRARFFDAVLIAALYIVSPFTLVYLSYGAFWTINVAIAIGVMPLLIHFFLRCFVDERNQFQWKSISALAACLIVIAWTIMFLLPTIFVLIGLFIAIGFVIGVDRLVLSKSGVLCLLFSAGATPAIYGMYLSVFDPGWTFSSPSAVMANAAYGNIKGGVLTGFLQHSGWPIYTLWSPRLLLGFHTHFSSPIYVWLTITLLVTVTGISLLTNKRQYLFSLVILLIALFFVKGAGTPLGVLFEWLLLSVPGAGLIRTPDTKFGVFVILAIAIAITSALATSDKKLYWFRVFSRLVVLSIVAYHAVPIVNGKAILGKNSELVTESSRKGYVVTLTQTEHKIIKLLQDESRLGLVILPPSPGINVIRQGSYFSYRHVIGEFVSNAIYLTGLNDITNEKVNQRVQSAIEAGDWEHLTDHGIGFVLINKHAQPDTAHQYGLYHIIRNVPDKWHKIIDDSHYELYRLNDANQKPIVIVRNERETHGAEILDQGSWFALIKAQSSWGSRFSITFTSAKNKHWRLVAVPSSCSFGAPICSIGGLISGPTEYLISRDLGSVEFQNRWDVEWRPNKTQALGSESNSDNVVWMIVFLPQILMWILLVVSIGVVTLCVYLAARKGSRSKALEQRQENTT